MLSNDIFRISFFNELFFGFILIDASDRLIIIDGIIMKTTGEHISVINHDGIPMTVNTPIGMNVKNENATNNDVSEIILCNIWLLCCGCIYQF